MTQHLIKLIAAGGMFVLGILFIVCDAIGTSPVSIQQNAPVIKPSVSPRAAQSEVSSPRLSDSPVPPVESATIQPEGPESKLMDSSLPEGCVAPTSPSDPVHLEPEGVDLTLAADGNPSSQNVLSMARMGDTLPDPPNHNPGVFAWDNVSGELANEDGVNALFMAHTYRAKDSPLGNQMIESLHEGDIIRATNVLGQTICYEVVERQVVPADYAEALSELSGKGLMIIIVCSDFDGQDWTTRTIWSAKLMK